MKKRKGCERLVKSICGLMCGVFAVTASCGIYMQAVIPDSFYMAAGEDLTKTLPQFVQATGLALDMPEHLTIQEGNSVNMQLSTYGNVAIKDVSVQVVERKLVIPGGMPFGIKMFTEGVMVVGTSDITTANGTENPAKSAGISVGDVILKVNGRELIYNEDLEAIVNSCEGSPIKVELERMGQPITTMVNPVVSSEDGNYKIGLWVRDSSAGLGTMTFIDPTTGVFAGLGHGVCDVDTGEIMPLSSGEISGVIISGLDKGYSGSPGQLKGSFTGGDNIGIMLSNEETGVYGIMDNLPSKLNAIPVAFKQEIKTGEAQLITTIDGIEPDSYDIVIEKINLSEDLTTKNMVIRVTDPELLDKTGGILQGMSGSPIIQNGQLVGAASHVFVNEPARGYAVFAENMLAVAEEIN